MEFKKKLLALVAVSSLSVSMAACSATNKPEAETPSGTNNNAQAPAAAGEAGALTPEEGAKLVIWESKDERVFTDEIAKLFTEKYNIPVQIDEIAPTDQVTRLTNDGPAGVGADVVVFPHDHLGRAASAQLILPNDSYAEETKKNNTDNAIQAVTFNNTLYGFPRAAETYALYYNKELVKEAPKSFEDVIAFSKTFTNKDKNKFGIMWETGNTYFNYPFIASTGGYLFGKNGTDKTDIGLNSEGAIAGMKVYSSLREILPVKSGDINPDIKRGLFTAGDVAMDINGPWELAGYKKALGDKLGIAPIPTVGGKPAVSFSGVKAWYVNSFSKYPNAAKLFANFASSKEAQLLLHKKVGAIPTNKEAQEDQQIKNDPIISGFVAQFKNSQPMPSIPEMDSVWNPLDSALTEVWNNGKDPKEALDTAATRLKELISSGKKQ
ncbi:sugar ABC transporter substrate-binding protein [Paenibacillus ehimensis]|uniref:sugar ABC transporter substrate-binding protein n=1 Tax=Paenibacillus ehimensis TaxID=79264 RepID=UPI000FDCC010|nr:maltose ABC transporter substrate-binding protein [Paenibacillus ehimensis]